MHQTLSKNVLVLFLDNYIWGLHEAKSMGFTAREIDIVACITSGRKTKKIAQLLFISPKTVETHIRNIMLKINCNSQDQIIDYLENSNKYFLFKKHYENLVLDLNFSQKLKKIKSFFLNKNYKFYIVYEQEKMPERSYIFMLSKYLQLLNIKTCILNTKELEKLNTQQNNNIEKQHFVFWFIYTEKDPTSKNIFLDYINSDRNFFLLKNNVEKNATAVLLTTQNAFDDFLNLQMLSSSPKVTSINSLVFKLLMNINGDSEFHKMISELKDKHADFETAKLNYKINITESKKLLKDRKFVPTLQLKKTAIFFILASAVCLFFIFYKMNYEKVVAHNKLSLFSLFKPSSNHYIQTWNLPFPNFYFNGRHNELKQIANMLEKKQHTTLPVALVSCVGMGGVGKTEIAKYYIHNVEVINKKKYTLKAWFNSEKIDKLIEQYVELAKQLKLDTYGNTSEDVIYKLKQWFENNTGWILVYDNVEKIDNILRFLPQRGGDIIVTSRNTDWPNSINIDLLSETEAVALLEAFVIHLKDKYTAKILVNELGRLPLAIAQAGAYISRNNISIENYLDLYTKRKDLLLYDATLPPTNDHYSVGTTISLSIDKIKESSKEAYVLLNIFAYLQPDTIYYEDLYHFMPTGSANEQKFLLEKAIKVLLDYSIIKMTSEHKITIHRLVQYISWLRQYNLKEHHKWISMLLDIANNTDEDVKFIVGAAAYDRDCFNAIVHYYENYLIKNKNYRYFHSLGCCYLLMGDFKKAEKCFLEGIKISNNSGLNVEYSLALYVRGNIEQAIDRAKQAISVNADVDYYISDLEKSIGDSTLQKMVDKYGVLRIKSSQLATYILIRCYQKLGDINKVNEYKNILNDCIKTTANPVIQDLLQSL